MSGGPLRLSEKSQAASVLSAAETASQEERLKQQREAAALMEKRIYVAFSKESQKLNGGGFPHPNSRFYKDLGMHEEKSTGDIHIQASENPKTTSAAIHVGVLNIMQKTLNPVIAAEGGTPQQNILLLQTLLAPSVSCSIAPDKLESIIHNIQGQEKEAGLNPQQLKTLIVLSRINSRLQASATKPLGVKERHQALEAAMLDELVKGWALDTAGISKEEAQQTLRDYEARLTQASEKTASASGAELQQTQPKEAKAAGASMDEEDDDPSLRI